MSMEIPFMDHVRHSLMIDKNKDVIIDKLLNLTLEIICLLTGEDYVVVRRSADLCVSEQRGRHVSDGCSEVQGLISGDSSPSPPLTEDNPPPRIPEPGRNLHRDTQKLPIKSEEAEVCVWDHSADQRGAVEVGAPELRSAAAHREGSPPRKCRTPECSQGQAPPSGDRTFHQCKEEEDSAVPGDVGAGGDDITHHQDQCLEDFIEEDSEMTAQEYQHPIKSEEAEVCVWDHSADQRGAAEVGAPELRSAEGPFICVAASSHVTNVTNQDRTFHQCKEEEDSAVPGDVGAGGDDITHHQDQCLEDFIEEESETTAQEYQHSIKSEEAEVCVWDHSADQRGAAEVGAPELRSAEGPFICVAASSHVTNVTNQDRTFHQCKEEEDSAVPGDVGAGGDDITHHQDQCLEDFIEEDSEMTAQEYQLPIKSEESEVCVWDHSADQQGAVEVGAPELRSADSSLMRMFESSVKGHQDTTDPTPHYVSAAQSEGSPPRKCRTPECSQGQAPLSGDGTFHQCKEEEDSAVPGDVGAGGDDITHHQDQCLEDFIEEESETTAQEYQPDVRTLHQPSEEEAAPDYMTSGSAISSLSHCSQDHFPRPPDPAVHPKSPSTNNPFSCSICGVRFASETTYADHRRYHAEERTYSCTFCGKSFNQRSRLLSHKRKHTGEKPFSCPVCGRCFAERSALVAHQRIHSGEKPFNCTECARSFVQRSSLVKHQRIHTGEQPFVCSQCGRRFSQSSNLVRHQRILHHFI
ncbi:uncharacterized protein [Engystomops pustulosus]|uniref:uncharacterized protein isoform X2 n=1 Tax=Engystomops pustulosus TaxID=76066 RepID=UPI003AFABB52